MAQSQGHNLLTTEFLPNAGRVDLGKQEPGNKPRESLPNHIDLNACAQADLTLLGGVTSDMRKDAATSYRTIPGPVIVSLQLETSTQNYSSRWNFG